jgi:hypothetical protein
MDGDMADALDKPNYDIIFCLVLLYLFFFLKKATPL